MNNQFKIYFLLFSSLFCLAFTTHKFYVSVFQIDFNNSKHQIEITSRIFIDDLEKTLKEKYQRNFYLTTKQEIAESEEYIKKYFDENLKIKINKKQHNLIFIAKETEENVLICYFKITNIKNPKQIEIKNTILIEHFKEQQNLIHFNILSNKKSILLTNTSTTEKLNF